MNNDDQLLQELDQNMDTVFDNLYVLNAAMTAMVNALPQNSAQPFVQALDQTLDNFLGGSNPPGLAAHQLLLGWRNQAAKIAAVAPRQTGK